jgi:hypothetical protein
MQVKQKYGTLEAGHVWLGLHRLWGCCRRGPGQAPEWLGQDRVALLADVAARLAGEPPDPARAHLPRPGERPACDELVRPGMVSAGSQMSGMPCRAEGA